MHPPNTPADYPGLETRGIPRLKVSGLRSAIIFIEKSRTDQNIQNRIKNLDCRNLEQIQLIAGEYNLIFSLTDLRLAFKHDYNMRWNAYYKAFKNK